MDNLKMQQLELLEQTYLNAIPQLTFSSPFELLVAVILSAQCTDRQVNKVTAELFPIANTPEKILELGVENLKTIIKPCGFYRSKAKHIVATSKILLEKYDSNVPRTFDGLIELPGVGRKTANVVLSIEFKIPAIAVDTHVFRVANRLKLAEGQTPLEVELGLQRVIPKDKWSAAHHWLIWHGRLLCHSRKPNCSECPLNEICPSNIKED